jgi:hypothetical protein
MTIWTASAQEYRPFSLKTDVLAPLSNHYRLGIEWQWNAGNAVEISAGLEDFPKTTGTRGIEASEFAKAYYSFKIQNSTQYNSLNSWEFLGDGRPLPAADAGRWLSARHIRVAYRGYLKPLKQHLRLVLQPGLGLSFFRYLGIKSDQVRLVNQAQEEVIIKKPTPGILRRDIEYYLQTRVTDEMRFVRGNVTYHLGLQYQVSKQLSLEARAGMGVHLDIQRRPTQDTDRAELNRYFTDFSLMLGWTLPTQWLRASKKA